MDHLPKISSLWIGGELSWLEQLCLKSFADAGHHTTLYSYSPIKNIPKGVHAGDAEAIYPSEPMLKHARTGSPAIHADMWRLHLLKKTDEIWVDADMYCHRAFWYPTEYVFGWEKKPKLVCNAVLGLPKDSTALDEMLDFFSDPYAIAPWLNKEHIKELESEREAGTPVHITEQNWGFTGPASVTYFLKKTGEIDYAQSVESFYPISFKDRNQLILTRFRRQVNAAFTASTSGVHFWARRMKPRLEEKENNTPRIGSYMYHLLERHGIDPSLAPIPKKTFPNTKRNEDPEFQNKIAHELHSGQKSIDKICREYLVDKSFVKSCQKKQIYKS